ncbi:hypothetical protein CVT26_010753 [Gymnopilus dilepis]|uniref:BTB domain-containing protein n=1 Tax=Gymnopilus dilepis TaxID=231916 RepID=A0A409Y0P8_9AGAR|nr:hypothetical protein CVT26_010753 [Gymnopilus dilepis]
MPLCTTGSPVTGQNQLSFHALAKTRTNSQVDSRGDESQVRNQRAQALMIISSRHIGNSKFAGPRGESDRSRPMYDAIETPEQITRSKYWFDDGNIILQAEKTQFRVHRSLLSNQSVVFRDMFSMPQPVALDPLVDGCPVVFLSDKVNDLGLVMAVFYDNFKVYNLKELMPFPLLTAILRIGKKYQIEHFQAEGLERLRSEFPKDLDAWDVSVANLVLLEEVEDSLENIINLAHELSIYSILPGAYVSYLSLVKMDEIIQGRKINDSEGGGGDTEVKPLRLNERALLQCLKGRDGLIRKFLDVIKSWLSQPSLILSPQCNQATVCPSIAAKAILNLPVMNFAYVSVLDPQDWDKPRYLCPQCHLSLGEAFNKARREIWADLPSYFGLPKWDELVDFA